MEGHPKDNNQSFESATLSEKIIVSGVYGDLSQNVIKITESDLELILIKHGNNIERKTWIGSLGLVASIATTLTTTKFEDGLLSSQKLEMIFYVALSLSIAWLVFEVFKSRKSITIEDLITKIKSKKPSK